jgi:hypothetical protein
MPESDQSSEVDALQNTWRTQEEQKRKMQISLTPEQLSAMAQSREKLNGRFIGSVIAVSVVLAAALLHNVYKIDQPWIRVGQAWTLGVIVYLVSPRPQSGRRKGQDEPCAQFLERQHEERRLGYLRFRRKLFLFIPGLAATWWGRDALPAAKELGLSRSSWLFSILAGPWPFVLAGAALVTSWFLFGKAAEKAARDREEIRRAIER